MSKKQRVIVALVSQSEVFGSHETADAAWPAFVEMAQLTEHEKPGIYGTFRHYWNKAFRDSQGDTSQFSADYERYVAQGYTPTGKTSNAPAPAPTRRPIEISTFNTAVALQSVDERMFANWVTNSEIDDAFSDEGGIMSATTVIVVGGPGVGKSTLVYFLSQRIKEFQPDLKVAVVSTEMDEEDLMYEAMRKPWMNSIDFVLTSHYGENIKEAFEEIFDLGYDLIVLDSFQDAVDKLRDMAGMTGPQAETWLLNKMKRTKGGHNRSGAYTTTIAIQQQTKGGNFAGSNKIKHSVTAMVELHRMDNGDRYLRFTKNRRCGTNVGKRLFYMLGANNNVMFDGERWEAETQLGVERATGAAPSEADMLRQFAQFDENAAAQLEALAQSAGAPASGESQTDRPLELAYHQPFRDEVTDMWISEPVIFESSRVVSGATQEASRAAVQAIRGWYATEQEIMDILAAEQDTSPNEPEAPETETQERATENTEGTETTTAEDDEDGSDILEAAVNLVVERAYAE